MPSVSFIANCWTNQESLSVQDLSDGGKVRLKRVTTNAKNYFKNPEQNTSIDSEILGEDDGE